MKKNKLNPIFKYRLQFCLLNNGQICSFPGQFIQVQPLPATAEEDSVQSEGVDSDHFSGSNSSFLANEKLMSVDSMNSDITGSYILYLNCRKDMSILQTCCEHLFDFQMMTLIQTTCLMMSWSCISTNWCLPLCREAEWRARRFLQQ